MDILERFQAKIRRDLRTGCWVWTAARDKGGYGQFRFDGQMIHAHRAAWILYVGDIPPGLHIDHLCRNRACVNPDHLEPVTCKVNILRSPIAPAAVNSRKTHCPRGHALDYVEPSTGKRRCTPCTMKRELRHVGH